MDVSAAILPHVAKPQPTVTPPSAQMALNSAAQAGQQTANLARTQTSQATQATAKGDQGRDTRSATQGGQSVDTLAGAIHARTNGSYGRHRGTLLDVTV